MGETSIQWTDRSVNPIRARHRKTGAVGHYCELFSSGCAHCYASALQKRFQMPAFPGKSRLPKLPVIDDRGCVIVNEDIELFLDQSKLDEVLKRKKPAKWFWCDMTDMFGSWVPGQWLDRMFAVMNATAWKLPIPANLEAKPWHTHQILTKRPERMFEYIESRRPQHWIGRGDDQHHPLFEVRGKVLRGHGGDIMNAGACLSWPLSNVWLGVSAEDQQRADERIPWLLKTPAAVRFVSAEPLLGPIDLSNDGCEYLPDEYCSPSDPPPRLDWIIVGGESGHDPRPCRATWVRDIVRQCADAGVACFVKQLGANAEDGHGVHRKLLLKDKKGGDPDEWPEDLRVRQFPEVAHA